MAKPAKLLFCAMKNEGPFILEWVAHHRTLGFDEIIVVSNDCDDGSARLLDALAAGGFLTHRPQVVPDGQAPQTAAVRKLEQEFDLKEKWVLWLDGDEFLNLHVGGGSLDSLISALGNAQGIAINWRVFGVGEMNIWQGENITEHQTGCAERGYKPHQAVKTLFRYGRNFTQMDVHAPLAAPDREQDFHLLDTGGHKIAQRAFFYDHNGTPKYRARMRHVVDLHKLAQINHYALRSRESFAFKSMRGDGTMTAAENDTRGQGNPAIKFRHGRKFWRKYDLNDCKDDSIHRYQAATKRLMAAMLEHPEIKAAYVDCCAQFATNRRALEEKLGLDLATANRWEFLSALD